jgi:predicted DNA-binding transcriptional regulator YafY
MSRPTSRVLALLEILQGGGTRRLADLADRLGVDERTVRRYVSHLIDLDIPVESLRGRYGGYRLAPGFRLPPLMLSDDEAVAVLLALEVARRTGPGESTASASASAKLQRVLPARLSRRLQALLATSTFTTAQLSQVSLDTDTLLTLAEAAADRRPVRITYRGRDGRHSERVIHPWGLVAHSAHWYLRATDASLDEVRTFRLDRIESTTLQAGSFEMPHHTDVTASVLESLADTPWTHQVSLRVRGSRQAVTARLPLGVALVQQIDSEPAWVRVRLRADRLDWLPALIAGVDEPFVVEEPAELRELIHAFARRLDASADA